MTKKQGRSHAYGSYQGSSKWLVWQFKLALVMLVMLVFLVVFNFLAWIFSD